MEKILIANWKMNPQTLGEAKEIFNSIASEATKYNSVKTIICPPFVFLEELYELLKNSSSKNKNIFLGAQNTFWETKGPFTGEISTDMLKNFDVAYILIGHSDRRYTIGETDYILNKKIRAVLAAGINPVFLIGEKKTGKDRNGVLADQLIKGLSGIENSEISKILFAYEPVWAISTNPGAKPDTPENTLDAIGFIKDFLHKNWGVKVNSCLYGGSVGEKNVFDYLKHQDINGAVVGAASLRKEEFANMLKLVSEIQ